MITRNTPKNSKQFICETCNFKCSNKQDYTRHLITRKHKMITNGNINDNDKSPKVYMCDCGKNYNFASGLSRHKTKCNFQQENTPKEENPPKEDDKDKVINTLIKKNDEMGNLVLLLVKNLQDSQEIMVKTMIDNQDNQNVLVKNMQDKQVEITTKIIKELIPHVGGTTNTTNTAGDHNNLTNSQNTLNFYLTHTCKDAESLTEFTSRFCERIETFFTGNFQKIANYQEDLAKNVQEMFFECLEDKPQENKFIQTTDTKNGIYFVKEPNKVEKELTFGDSKFVKYKDGFEKTGSRIGHEINKVLQPSRNECMEEYKKQLVSKPKEEDYEEDEDYEKAKDEYHKSTGKVEENLMYQTYHAGNIFENKKTKEKIMSNTKRPKVEA